MTPPTPACLEERKEVAANVSARVPEYVCSRRRRCHTLVRPMLVQVRNDTCLVRERLLPRVLGGPKLFATLHCALCVNRNGIAD